MKGILYWGVLVVLSNIRYLKAQEKFEDQKITYVQIKPISELNVDSLSKTSGLLRTSKIENIPLHVDSTTLNRFNSQGRTPVIEVIRNTRQTNTDKNIKQNQNVESKHSDYINQDAESEARFDTSEAIIPNNEDESTDDNNFNKKINTSQENDLLPSYVRNQLQKNGLIKNKFHGIKKYYGNTENVHPNYRKYLETRQFRSRCRCERIWNCPKLQISVPRCPEEYFMCCF